MRDLADLYDIVDLQLSAVKLERMFMCEMEDLVDTEMQSIHTRRLFVSRR